MVDADFWTGVANYRCDHFHINVWVFHDFFKISDLRVSKDTRYILETFIIFPFDGLTQP